MAIFSNEQRKLIFKWEIAALDLPIPDSFDNREDMQDWSRYVSHVSPSQKVRKFGQALDQLHTIAQKENDLNNLTEKDKELLSAKRDAVTDLALVIFQNFEINEKDQNNSASTILLATARLIDFLKNVNSPDAELWQEREARHKLLEKKIFGVEHTWPWEKPQPPNSKSGPSA